jgi:hypothetical protein
VKKCIYFLASFRLSSPILGKLRLLKQDDMRTMSMHAEASGENPRESLGLQTVKEMSMRTKLPPQAPPVRRAASVARYRYGAIHAALLPTFPIDGGEGTGFPKGCTPCRPDPTGECGPGRGMKTCFVGGEPIDVCCSLPPPPPDFRVTCCESLSVPSCPPPEALPPGCTCGPS